MRVVGKAWDAERFTTRLARERYYGDRRGLVRAQQSREQDDHSLVTHIGARVVKAGRLDDPFPRLDRA
jgi:hypothetical protein